ncbi:MAG: hypothetical protein HYW50_00995, partial [Candidatus Diapherotrites archaeon]|nr:hypothetical protein [Candidatus Diapherotrites archaeon]
EILESIRAKMEQYARDLSQPSIMLFYLGVLLPLILIIILPVGSSFSGAPLANPIVLALIYLIVLPAVTYIFARTQIISKRPPVFEPPKIDDSFPGLPPKNKMLLGKTLVDARMVALAVLVVGTVASLYISAEGIPPKSFYSILNISEETPQVIPADKQKEEVILKAGLGSADHFSIPEGRLYRQLKATGLSDDMAAQSVLVEEKKFFTKSEHDIAPYNQIFGLLITVTSAASIFLYYTNIYKRRAQLELIQLEQEFKDSLYIIASRMGENKPLEEALKNTQEFLPNYKISQTFFPKIVDNISMLSMPVDKAIFDKDFGALKNIPSTIMQSGMRLLVDSVELGVNVAARSMIALSIQISNQEKVNNSLKLLVGDITSMMKVMSLFIAPLVLGITTALQKIVIITLSSIAASDVSKQFDLSNVDLANLPGGAIPSTFSGLSVGSFIDPAAIASMASPSEFIFIIAVFVIEVVVIMTFFTTMVEEENKLLFKINLSKYLPIAVVTFVLSIIAANVLIGGFLGG